MLHVSRRSCCLLRIVLCVSVWCTRHCCPCNARVASCNLRRYNELRCTALMSCVASQRLWRSHRFRKKVDKIVEDKRRLRAYACQCGPTDTACHRTHATSDAQNATMQRRDAQRATADVATMCKVPVRCNRALQQSATWCRPSHAGACDMRGWRVRYAWLARAICVAGACFAQVLRAIPDDVHCAEAAAAAEAGAGSIVR